MPPLAWVGIFSFIVGALTFQFHLWTSIRAELDEEEEDPGRGKK